MHVSMALNHYGQKLEAHFGADVLSYIGAIPPAFLSQFLESVERLVIHHEKAKQQNPKRIVVVLTTSGGVVEAVEKMVEIIRHHFDEVFFVVPESAMSAGTIWCMSGDKIYMDYSSSLGPIDPQVAGQDGRFVPALGYIDKVNDFIDRSKTNDLTPAEYMMLKGLDLGVLRRYEQARDLSISLLKQWLVKYKFKDWSVHRTTNSGAPVTDEEKAARAEAIALQLSDNKLWHSHGRMIGIDTLRRILKLEIEDYSTIADLRYDIRTYSGLLSDYLEKLGLPMMIHNTRIS